MFAATSLADPVVPPCKADIARDPDTINAMIAKKREAAILRRGEVLRRRIEETAKQTRNCRSMLDDDEPIDYDHCDEPIDYDHYDGALQGDEVNASGNKSEPAFKKRKLNSRQKYDEASRQLRIAKETARRSWVRHGTSSSSTGVSRDPRVNASIDEAQVPFASEVHPSHHKMLLRNVLFCRKCGYWGSRKTQKLTSQCQNMPPHSDGKCKLNRMMNGLHPDRNIKQWTDGLDAQIRTAPINLDGL